MLKTLGSLIDLFYPRSCLVCGRSDFWLCPACESCLVLQKDFRCVYCGKPSINGASHPLCGNSKTRLDGLVAAGHYSQLEDLIHSMKYGLITALSIPFGELLIKAAQANSLEQLVSKSLIIPVPLHPRRLRERGFNQSELLANQLSERFHTEVCRALRRVQDKTTQATLTRQQRLKNQEGVYNMAQNFDVKNKSAMLIDDVATTGATLIECASVLKKAGAISVWALVLAHGG